MVELGLDRGRLIDTTSGSIWEPARGEPLSGPLAVPLVHLPAFTEFPRDFSVHFPGARTWQAG